MNPMELLSSATALISGASASVGLLKAKIDIQAFNEAATQIADVNDKLIEAQQKLFAHGAAMLVLQDENRQLAERARELGARLADRGLYELTQLAGGDFAYQAVGAEPAHYICQPCFDLHGLKSILQPRAKLWCPNCNRAFGPDSSSAVQVFSSRGRWDGA